MPASLVTALIGLADDHLILGHRLSEWCGHAPMLEEDLAMPNILPRGHSVVSGAVL